MLATHNWAPLTTVRHVGGQAVAGGEHRHLQAVAGHQRVLAPGGGHLLHVCSQRESAGAVSAGGGHRRRASAASAMHGDGSAAAPPLTARPGAPAQRGPSSSEAATTYPREARQHSAGKLTWSSNSSAKRSRRCHLQAAARVGGDAWAGGACQKTSATASGTSWRQLSAESAQSASGELYCSSTGCVTVSSPCPA